MGFVPSVALSLAGSVTLDLGLSNLQLPHPSAEIIKELLHKFVTRRN